MRLVLAIGASIAVLDCGPSDNSKVNTRREGSTEPTEQGPPIKDVTAKGTEIQVNGEEKGTYFVVRSKESDITFAQEGVMSGVLMDVTGQVVKGETVVSRFQGRSGTVDRAKERVSIDGQVQVSDEKRGLKMRSESLVYDQELERFVAKGAVTVTSDGMVLGPLPEIWATPDLKKIATPGKFK